MSIHSLHRPLARCGGCLLLCASLLPTPARAEGYFDPHAFAIDNPGQVPVDLSAFATPGGQQPGRYRVVLMLNRSRVDTRDVTFVTGSDQPLEPQFTPQALAALGVAVDRLPALRGLPTDQPIAPLSRYIPDARARFDFARQTLALSIPQAALRNAARGSIDPARWDNGIPALLASYNLSGNRALSGGESATADSDYLNLISGANLGAWRLRNYATWFRDEGGSRHWQPLQTWVQRDLVAWRSKLRLGDSATGADLFESVPFRGVRLASDETMLPDSQRGFAPVVRGIANSNARVTIRQNGNVIDQRTVPPGPFALADLYPTSYGGTLEVTVTEADGSERHFSQAFSSVPVMQREGQLEYELSGGELLTSGSDRPGFGQLTLRYGFPHGFTGYGGLLLSPDYQATLLGAGLGLGYAGSLALDATTARARLADPDAPAQQGTAWRVQYSNHLDATDTTLTLSASYVADRGYFTFSDAAVASGQAGDESEAAWRRDHNRRNRLQFDLSQSLGRAGSLTLSAYQQSFWDTGGAQRNVMLGYVTHWGRVSLNLNLAWVENVRGYEADDLPGSERQLSLTLQVPLDRWRERSWLSYTLNTDASHRTGQLLGVNGNALADDALSYQVQAGYDNQQGGGNGLASVTYRGAKGEGTVGASHDQGGTRLNYRALGSVVAHSGGLTLGQSLGDTVALVQTPGAAGIRVRNVTGGRTDGDGDLLVPSLMPYRENLLALDTTTLPANVDVPRAAQTRVPTQGAVVRARFDAHLGYRVVVSLRRQGQPLPFGAIATLLGAEGNSGIVGDNGELYLSGVPARARLAVKWGDGPGNACTAAFTLPAAPPDEPVRAVTAECR
ncbi:fimbria/pilus outer membrane usher protein [Nissabacter sp. SGAir0207]|uniref:fimbria/pilus outer membrane usher protein n=1 Tax=Nissabacter sp. SGAir0207 TaxID=2126321 RepID=UPI0010CD4CB8|nr:fimbria/pilus outer membrane usher protein [Nissabacter sp. SGAir0207]QCR36658.1 fimbrial assembly protein [Nissabacter sp. SGAir0207]